VNRREFLAAAAAPPLLARQTQDTEAFARSGGRRTDGVQTWFSQSGFGLFVTWGICTVREVELGWGFYGENFGDRLRNPQSVTHSTPSGSSGKPRCCNTVNCAGAASGR
jgi:hypothetical protein